MIKIDSFYVLCYAAYMVVFIKDHKMTETAAEEKDVKEELRSVIMRGEIDKAKELIAGMSVEELNTPRSKGKKETLLMTAVNSGNLEMVDLLLSRGADVNVPGGRGDTVFDMLPIGDIDKRNAMAKKLIDAGAIQIDGEFAGRTDLMWAVQLKDKQEVRRLIAEGADLNAKDAAGSPVWEFALQCEDKEVLQELVTAGMDINNTFNADGKNLFMQVLYLQDDDTAKFLLEHGADVNAESKSGARAGYTPVFFAQNPAMIQQLAAKGADVNHCAKDGVLPMMGRNAAEMEVFINAGADVHKTDSRTGMNYMTKAALKNGIEEVKLLLRAGLDINAKDENGWTPLMYAAASKAQVGAIRQTPPIIVKTCKPSAEFVQKMIDNGAKVTPEVLALAKENEDIRKVLENAEKNNRQSLKDDMKKQATVSAYFQEKKVKETAVSAAAIEKNAVKAERKMPNVQFMKNQTGRQA